MRRTPRDSGPQGTPPEDQESEGKFDFVKFFLARMDAFGPADPRFAGGIQYDLEEARIKDIRKFVPAILFETGNDPRIQQKELWVGDPLTDVDPEYFHHEAREEMNLHGFTPMVSSPVKHSLSIIFRKAERFWILFLPRAYARGISTEY